jgi:DNA/RNA-binding domain of Phe-tRNA-synthetase-like protein
MRKLFRGAGCDPTRYRPASEALLRRLVKGAELPEIHPLVDVNNCLSAELAAPCCVMAEGTLGSSLLFRRGESGESYESLRGPFNLDAKPLLVDELGPIDTPITGGVRVKVKPDTERAWLVAYLPAAEISADEAWPVFMSIANEAGIEADQYSPVGTG